MPYQKPDGTWSAYPLSRDEAVRTGSVKYDDNHYCPTCDARPGAHQNRMRCSIKYTATDKCVLCATLEAIAFYNTAACGLPWDESVAWTYEMHTAYTGTPLPRSASTGADVWVSPDPCPKAGHVGLKTPDGKCHVCASSRTNQSPRQTALAAGEKWYTPTDPCPKCGTTAPRRVDNGQCKGCRPTGEHDARQTPDSVMMREQPDTVVSRDDARLLGFKVYRTGNPCRSGHTGWRYVSTGSCIDCLRGR